MRGHRDTVIAVTVALVTAVVIAVVLMVVLTPNAGAHRVVSDDWAQRSANEYIHTRYCGGGGWSCTSVWVPVIRCGMHSYCWHGVSHRECVRSPFWGCIWNRSRSSSGTINGHTGQVTGYGVW